jgi:hypothetical protein
MGQTRLKSWILADGVAFAVDVSLSLARSAWCIRAELDGSVVVFLAR